ncbi:MAG TPA: NAD(P)-binding domain-containing protein [Gaiellaceae bacterium]|nr:NAD(P)-binding domain-containing protein [Gaiellaceae bacterium]
MRVAIIGGTGPFGRGLAARLHAAGDTVIVGSRDAAKAKTLAGELGVEGDANAEAVADVELAVLAVNAEAAVETARSLAGALGSTPVLSVASELGFGANGARPGAEGPSLAERVAAAVDAPVAAGLHSVAARNLGEEAPDEDAFVCGDDPAAKALALELASRVVAGRALDAGPLAAARALEGLTAVIVNLNRGYKGHAGLRVTGLP